MKGIACLFLYLTVLQLQAQQLDSLENLLLQAPEDTNKVRIYFQLYGLTAYNDPARAQAYIDQAYTLADKLNDQRGIILCYDKWGGIAMADSDYPRALYHYRKADSLLQYLDWPREKAVIYANYAAIYKDQGQYDSCLLLLDTFTALATTLQNQSFLAFADGLKGDIFHLRGQHNLAARHYLAALRVYEANGDSSRLGDAFRLLGATQTAARRYADAEKNLLTAIGIYSNINEKYYLAQAYRDLGYLYSLQKNWSEAATYYQQSLSLAEELEDSFGIAQSKENLGENALERNFPEQALQYQMEALALYRQMNDPYSIANVLQIIGNAYYKLKQYDQALDYTRQSEEIYNRLDAGGTIRWVYQNYADIYAATGKPEMALRYYRQYEALKDSFFTIEQNKQLEELQLIYAVEKKDQEIELLSKNLELSRLRRKLLTGGILATLILAILAIYHLINRRKREVRLREEQLRRKAAELEKSQLEKAQLERELAAQVLHLCRKNELLDGLQNEINQLTHNAGEQRQDLKRLQRTIQSDLNSDEDWGQFLATFEKVHPDFLVQLNQNAEPLSPAEQRLSCLYKMNLSSKEIATILHISDEGIKKARYRLRKKLGLPTDINLQDYLMHFPGNVISN